MESVEIYPKAYVSTRWTKDVVPRSAYGFNMSNVPTTEKKEEIQTIIRDLYFSMDFCIDRLVNDIEKLKIFRDEMNEKKTNVEGQTKNSKPMKNKEVIQSFMGIAQKKKINVLPPNQINNKGTRTMKKQMKGKMEIAIEHAKKDGRTCHKCGMYIKYGAKEKHDTRNCHKFQIQEKT